MAAILHERLLCTSQIEASTSLPWATPWAFEFLENFWKISPFTGLKSGSNVPTARKITRLLFKLFSSFYYVSEAVH